MYSDSSFSFVGLCPSDFFYVFIFKDERLLQEYESQGGNNV